MPPAHPTTTDDPQSQPQSESTTTSRPRRSTRLSLSNPTPAPAPAEASSSASASRQTRSITKAAAAAASTAAFSSSSSKRKRDPDDDGSASCASKGKGKGKAKAPRNINTPLTIHSPPRDPKGKKRAAPSPSPPPEDATAPSASKKQKYNLRSVTASSSTNKTADKDMPKKARSPTKPRGKAAARVADEPSSSSRINDDLAMDEAEYSHPSSSEHDSDSEGSHDDDAHPEGGDDSHPYDDEDDDGGEDDMHGGGGGGGGGSIFADYRALSGLILGQSGRYKAILTELRARPYPPGTGDGTQLMIALQELAELLSVATEDTLAGYFQVEAFAKELIAIMSGEPPVVPAKGGGEKPGQSQQDADLMAALAASGGGFGGDGDGEAMLLACRCLANLMEALPGTAHSVVHYGAVPVLCSKLVEIQFVDLAEEAVSTLGKIAEECPNKIVAEGGLAAVLNYLDFFNSHVQRTALTAAANCCRSVSVDNFSMVRDVVPIIRNVLGYADQRLVEQACLCVVRIIDSYKARPDLLEQLLEDGSLVGAVIALLLPTGGAGGSPLISSGTYTALLRAMATAGRSSPKAAIALLETNIVDTLYHILTGVLVPTDVDPAQKALEDGAAPGEGGLADMVVLENLARRPKDQVDEALSLALELLPPLPKGGVFDAKAYLGKAFKGKGKEAAPAPASTSASTSEEASSAGPSSTATAAAATDVPEPIVEAALSRSKAKEAAREEALKKRVEMLRAKPALVVRFMSLMVPVFVEVYAASVALPVRNKTISCLLKVVAFAEAEGLRDLLRFIPLASFLGGILSSRDHPTLVTGALQLVELLVDKLPDVYRAALRRQGVMYEIEVIASEPLFAEKKDAERAVKKEEDAEDAAAVPIPIPIPSPSPRDPQDAIVARARTLRDKLAAAAAAASDQDGGHDEAKEALEGIRSMVDALNDPGRGREDVEKQLAQLAEWFTRDDPISSFELLRSGLIEGLLKFATEGTGKVSSAQRHRLLFKTFSSVKSNAPGSATALASLVKRLQESLSRLEPFDVVSAAQSAGGDESRRNATSMLARQLRLRLIADDPELAKAMPTMVVSIHAIASLQALNDYLRPRISAHLASAAAGGSGSRLSGVLAALSAAAGIPAGGAGEEAERTEQEQEHGEDEDGAAPGPTGRRRSGRLSGKGLGSSMESGEAREKEKEEKEGEGEGEGAAPGAASASAMHADEPEHHAEGEGEGEGEGDGFDEEMMDDEYDEEEIYDEDFEEEMQGGSGSPEKTVSLDVAPDGSKIEAKTPDGTRVSTPTPGPSTSKANGSGSGSAGGVAAGTSASASGTPSKGSYAAMLKSKPSDWHLEFRLGDDIVPMDSTIYGAVHRFENRTGAGMHRNVWSNVYTVKYKKVPGPAPATKDARASPDAATRAESAWDSLPASIPSEAAHAPILQLLRVLHALCSDANDERAAEQESAVSHVGSPAGGETSFVNNKLTAKLSRQLEEPMLIASSCLPEWSLDLPTYFPFLFTFQTRYAFLQAQSWGAARLITKWQNEASRSQDSRRNDPSAYYLGRLQRQKVRISREYLLESAIKVFELYGGSATILEIEYFEEVGTGLGPTLEFYSLVSKEFAKKELKLWRGSDDTADGDPSPFVFSATGLFPAPISEAEAEKESGKKRLALFKLLGQFLAKGLLDSRIIDVSFNTVFMKLVLGRTVPLTLSTVKLVDRSLGNSLERLQEFVDVKKTIEDDESLSAEQKTAAVEDIEINGAKVEDMSLDFTLPGYADYELTPGGTDRAVTIENVEQYIQFVIETTLVKGTQKQVAALRSGFSRIFPISDMAIFAPEELATLFGTAEEDWSIETLGEVIKADHGYNADSRTIRYLVELMSEFDQPARREFLSWASGATKLPVGGFRALFPPLTVVRKPVDGGLTADAMLPSVMTCANYLKLPEYSSKDVLRARLSYAMKEGSGSFNLS